MLAKNEFDYDSRRLAEKKSVHKLKNPLILFGLYLIVSCRLQAHGVPYSFYKVGQIERDRVKRKMYFRCVSIISKQFVRQPINHSTLILLSI